MSFLTDMYKLITIQVPIYFMLINTILGNNEDSSKSSTSLRNFRKYIEELPSDRPLEEGRDTSNNLVSFLVNNIKEIYGESEEPLILFDPENNETTLAIKSFVATSTTENNDEIFETTEDRELNESTFESIAVTETSIIVKRNDNVTSTKVYTVRRKTTELLNLSRTSPQKIEKVERENQALKSIDLSVLNKTSLEKEINTIRRSCISCNNVAVMECSEPKNRLIPSIVCEREDDLCYSQHTPFGIVDRGCFNINHDISTYVCSCHLCNFISISEMPFIFTSKRAWVDNVIEMSRTKRFRKSIFKDMSCLRCEVNTSTKTGDMSDNANCLEGNVGTLPIQECADNEICGVKSIRSEGYIWRGCLTKPLYNYWWALCDTDLCNYDNLVSVYDTL